MIVGLVGCRQLALGGLLSFSIGALCLSTQARAEVPQEAPPIARLQTDGQPQPPERVSVLVYLAEGIDRSPVRAFAAEHGGFVKYEYKVVLPNVVNLRDIPVTALQALENLPGVVRVEEDRYYEDLIKLDESTPLIRALQSQITGAGLSATGAGVRVCVCDTGIDTNHIMYADRIDLAASYDFHNDDPNPEDDNGHGAHVAGIAVGRSGLSVDFGCEGSEPFQGVAPEATLIGAKILDRRGGGFTSRIIAGIDHCADQSPTGGRADVINLSIGTGQFSSICDGQHSWADAANDAADAGVVVVAASGNECFSNALASPACGSKVIAVGATYDDTFPNCEDGTSTFNWSCCSDSGVTVDDVVCFSNESDNLDVTAPGAVIWSAFIGRNSNDNGTSITPKSGTSMASPQVAGLAALILSADPSLTPAQVRQVIRDGAVDLGPAGFDRGYGYGRIDVINSLSLLTPEVCNDGTCGPGEDQCNCPQDCGTPPGAETNCNDGIDNDCDGNTDCGDADCSEIPPCDCVPTHSKEKGPRCSDGIDNDCDGLIDGDDPDC